MPIELILLNAVSSKPHLDLSLDINAVEHTLAAAIVNASQKHGETQTVECLKLSPSFPNSSILLLSQPG